MKLLWLLRLRLEVNSKTRCNYILLPLTLENQNGFTAAIILLMHVDVLHVTPSVEKLLKHQENFTSCNSPAFNILLKAVCHGVFLQ